MHREVALLESLSGRDSDPVPVAQHLGRRWRSRDASQDPPGSYCLAARVAGRPGRKPERRPQVDL